MDDPVWHRLDRELTARRERHLAPGSWAEVARALKTTEQRVNNWTRRGVPSAQYAALATIMGWSVDQLLGLVDDASPTSSAPPLPPVDFQDRRLVSDSDWATLHAVKLLLPEEKLKELRQQAEHVERMVKDELTATAAGASAASNVKKSTPSPSNPKGTGVRGSSIFGDLDDLPVTTPQKGRGGKS